MWIRLYNDALNRLETLRDAIAGAVTECGECARHAHDRASVPERTAANVRPLSEGARRPAVDCRARRVEALGLFSRHLRVVT